MRHQSTFMRAAAFLLVVVCGIIWPISTAYGLFIRPDLVNVPVTRLVDNLEGLIKKKPKDVKLRYNLARVHAMAYALKTDTTKIRRNKENAGAWFGYTPKTVPFKAKKAKTMEEMKAANKHLEKALQTYEEVIKMAPKHLPSRLGHAWLLDKSGKNMQAIKEYREVIKMAWAKEGKKKTGPLGGNFITVEAAGYLIPHLNEKSNQQEIQTLKQRIEKLKKLPRPITPIAVPLHDGLKLDDIVDKSAKVRFDADGTGMDRSWTWIKPNAAWLVYDPHQRKEISSALQMFGNVTFWLFWENGYQAMETLDNNQDGFLSGAELQGIAVWHDRNSNGMSEPGEVRSLPSVGIVKLSCRHQAGTSSDCAAHSRLGVYFRDGSVRPTFDVILHQQ